MEEVVDIEGYNKFCSNLTEGSVLYNVDSTNCWGNYLLVANISKVKVGNTSTFTVLMLGLNKIANKFLPRNFKIRFTPAYMKSIPFLKYVGRCKFSLTPVLENIKINTGLVAIYGQTDLHRYSHHADVRKPKNSKYDKEGNSINKNNKQNEIENSSQEIQGRGRDTSGELPKSNP